jgi:hypothetical protein
MTAAGTSPERVEQTRPRPGDAEPDRTGRRTLSDRLPAAWLFPLLVSAASWILILAAWYISDAVYGQGHAWTWHFLFKDANYYLGIAQHGYPVRLPSPWHDSPVNNRAAFFPLFPLAVRLASYLTGGSYAAAGLVVQILAGAASAVGVWAVAARVRDRRVADRAVMLYGFFPGAMTLAMLYSEPLAVALSAAAILAMLNRRWLIAGIIGAAATAERPTLVVLVVIFGIAAVQAIWTRREWSATLAPALTPLGVVAFFGYLGYRYHDYKFWFHVETDVWNEHVGWGEHTFRVVLWLDPATEKAKVFNAVLIIMFVAAVVGIAMMVAARLPIPVTLFGVLIVALSVISPAQSTRPRFVWTAFPIFIGAAKLPRFLYWPVLVLSAAGLFFLIAWWPNHRIGPAP